LLGRSDGWNLPLTAIILGWDANKQKKHQKGKKEQENLFAAIDSINQISLTVFHIRTPRHPHHCDCAAVN
jgi:hypothetical protein